MFKKITFSMIALSTLANAAGYKIPEQSLDSVALLSSNIAVSFSPDAAYYNPANMPFLSGEKHYFENTLGWFHIAKGKFRSNEGKIYKSETFNSAASTFHFVSPKVSDNWRFGVSLAVPAGVGISWKDPEAALTARRFKLKIIELNPSAAYQINDKLSVAAGVRVIYSKGRVINEFARLGNAAERRIEGDGFAYGYNLALTYKPIQDLSLAATYRSNVDITLKGDAKMSGFPSTPITTASPATWQQLLNYNGNARVGLPLPATLSLGMAYKLHDTTLMFAYDRTFWSKFDGYDFEYGDKERRHANTLFAKMFDDKVQRHYKDTNTFRFGVAYEATKKLRLMAAVVYDEGAANDKKSVGFELPDTDSMAYSAGFNYKINEDLEFGLGYIYQDRKATEASVKTMSPRLQEEYKDGKFQKGSISILAASVKYKF